MLAIYRKRVVVECELAFAVLAMEHFHFVYHVFGISYTVASAEHAYGAAEITPLNASTASNQGKDGFSHTAERGKRKQMVRWGRQRIQILQERSVFVAKDFLIACSECCT
jgi:hypothetical protein